MNDAELIESGRRLLKEALTHMMVGQQNAAILILHQMLGEDATPPQVISVPEGKRSDISGFHSAFATACRKNGIADAAFVIFVPSGEKTRRVVGGTDKVADYLARALDEVGSTRTDAMRLINEMKDGDELLAGLEAHVKAAVIGPDPEDEALAAVEYLIIQRSNRDRLPFVIGETPELGTALALSEIIEKSGGDAVVVRRLLTPRK